MLQPELAYLADANYRAAYSAFTSTVDGGEVRERDGLLIAASGLPLAFFNVAFITRPLPEPEAQVSEAIRYFEARGLPYQFSIREGMDEATERVAKAHGLQESRLMPCMALAPLTETAIESCPLSVAVVEDAETLAKHAEVLAAGFGMPQELASRMMHPRWLHNLDARFYVGYLGKLPVATSALVLTHRVAGVYSVATLERYRRRGYGAAMTLHAVRDGARLGCAVAALQTSQMGYPLYEKLRFQRFGNYRLLWRPHSGE